MLSAAVALLLLGDVPIVSDVFGQPDHQVEHHREAGWRLDVTRDKFTGATTCKIRHSSMTYEHGVVVFQFGHGVDTANAMFRVDGGAARPASAVTVEAASLGARFGSDNLNNPSNGVVNIPAAEIGDARRVDIRPDQRASHQSFDMTGLSQAIAAARTLGCDVPEPVR